MSDSNGVENRRKVFHKQVTLGNILSMAMTAVSIIGGVFYLGSAVLGQDKRIVDLERVIPALVRVSEQNAAQINLILDRILPQDHADAQ